MNTPTPDAYAALQRELVHRERHTSAQLAVYVDGARRRLDAVAAALEADDREPSGLNHLGELQGTASDIDRLIGIRQELLRLIRLADAAAKWRPQTADDWQPDPEAKVGAGS